MLYVHLEKNCYTTSSGSYLAFKPIATQLLHNTTFFVKSREFPNMHLNSYVQSLTAYLTKLSRIS